MTRAIDLDRAYSLLVQLCEHPQPVTVSTSCVLMDAFNTFTEQHTPRVLYLSDAPGRRDVLLAEATDLLTHLARTAIDLQEALALGRSAELLRSLTPHDKTPP